MSRFNKADFLKKLHEIQKDKKFVPDSVWDEKFFQKTISTNTDEKHLYSIGERATLCKKTDAYNQTFKTSFWIDFKPTNGGMFLIQSVTNKKSNPLNTKKEPITITNTKRNQGLQLSFF